MELNVFELRSKNIHFAPVFENYFIVEVNECFFGLENLRILNKRFPDFGFLEDKDFYYIAIGSKKLIEIVMCYDIPILIIDAYQQNGRLIGWVLALLHTLMINKLHKNMRLITYI